MAPTVAVIGTGFGARVHVPALRAAGFDVVALVGTDADRTARRAVRVGVPEATTDLVRVLTEVDAVTIATPPATHRQLAVLAARAGRHVWCEKPFALNATEARDMVATAERAGVVALVGHEFRWAEDRAVLGRAIADGLIGTPRLATLVASVPLLADPEARMPAWWFDPAMGGGWLGASGSHVVDQIRVWLGEFAAVAASLGRVGARTMAVEDTFTIKATLRNDCQVVLQQTAGAWGAPTGLTRVAGERGTLSIEDGCVWFADATGTRALPVAEDLRLPEGPARSDDPTHAFTHLELGPETRLAEAFRRSIETGIAEAPVPVPTFADGLAAMQVLDAVRFSAASDGARVSV